MTTRERALTIAALASGLLALTCGHLLTSAPTLSEHSWRVWAFARVLVQTVALALAGVAVERAMRNARPSPLLGALAGAVLGLLLAHNATLDLLSGVHTDEGRVLRQSFLLGSGPTAAHSVVQLDDGNEVDVTVTCRAGTRATVRHLAHLGVVLDGRCR